MAESGASGFLGAADIRRIAREEGIEPTKKWGQNFVIDPGTVRRIVRAAGVKEGDRVLEVGPGLGSLTLGLLEAGAQVTAVEIDPRLAARLPRTARQYQPGKAGNLTVIERDAMTLDPGDPAFAAASGLEASTPFALVANLPYNIATPLILTLLERFGGLSSFLVMVQKEVADRLTAAPGGKEYGAPSAKLAWYGPAHAEGTVGRSVFWPAPHVDSALAGFTRASSPRGDETLRRATFALIDAAFAGRRKTLHAALRRTIGDEVYEKAGIDPTRRGETLTIDEFTALARAAQDALATEEAQ